MSKMIRITVEIQGADFQALSDAIEAVIKPYDVLLFRAEEVTKSWQIKEI